MEAEDTQNSARSWSSSRRRRRRIWNRGGSLGNWWSGNGHRCFYGLVGPVMSTKIKSKMQENGYFLLVFLPHFFFCLLFLRLCLGQSFFCCFGCAFDTPPVFELAGFNCVPREPGACLMRILITSGNLASSFLPNWELKWFHYFRLWTMQWFTHFLLSFFAFFRHCRQPFSCNGFVLYLRCEISSGRRKVTKV